MHGFLCRNTHRHPSFLLENVLQEAADNENVSKAPENGGFFFVVPQILRHAHIDNTREKTHYYGSLELTLFRIRKTEIHRS